MYFNVEIQVTSKQARAIADAVARFTERSAPGDRLWDVLEGIKHIMPSFESAERPLVATFTTREMVAIQLALETYRARESLGVREHRSLQAYLTAETFTAYARRSA